MKSLCAFVGGALLAFLGLGWYFNWYTIAKTPGSVPGHTSISVDLNTKKIDDDTSKAGKAVSDKVHSVIDGAPSSTPPKP